MTVTYMKDGSSKAWDKTLRTYEIKWPSGKKELWKDITALNCLTKNENVDPYGNRLELKEIVQEDRD